MEKLYLTLQGTAPRRPEVSSLQITILVKNIIFFTLKINCAFRFIFPQNRTVLGTSRRRPLQDIAQIFIPEAHFSFIEAALKNRASESERNKGGAFLHIFRRKIYHPSKTDITYSEGINITFCEAKNITKKESPLLSTIFVKEIICFTLKINCAFRFIFPQNPTVIGTSSRRPLQDITQIFILEAHFFIY